MGAYDQSPSSTLSGWIAEIGMFATVWMDGTIRCPNGFRPDVDPATIHWVADRTVRRIANRDGHLRRTGFTMSPTALATALAKYGKGKRERALTTAEMLAHPVFGQRAPSLELILAANEEEAAA